MRLANFQISLHIRAVWLESSLGAFWIKYDAKFNRDSDKTGRQKVRFLTLWLILSDYWISQDTGY